MSGVGTTTVDVTTQIEISLPRDEVFAYVSDPDNAPEWYVNIKSVEWQSPKPLALGSKIAFVAQFLGRRMAYTFEIADLVPGDRLVMRSFTGPFPMETSYKWESIGANRTRMSLRNRGGPRGIGRVFGPWIARSMEKANRKDLETLKALLEGRNQV
jgi:uncharacterized membrane protein